MKFIMLLISWPFILLGYVLFLNKNILSDYYLCLKYIGLNKSEILKIDDLYYNTLVVAEDHRNSVHFGIDPIAIMRSVYVNVINKSKQGASTIEQQLVRTLTNRYERTFRRKIREQAISVMLCLKIKDKKIIGKAYLHCAYFGYMKKGFYNLDFNDIIDPSELIARLKYPTKKNERPDENIKILIRKGHINTLMERNVSFFTDKIC